MTVVELVAVVMAVRWWWFIGQNSDRFGCECECLTFIAAVAFGNI